MTTNSTDPTPRAATWNWARFRTTGLVLLALAIVAFNGIAFLHAWALTHYAPVDTRSTRLREIQTWSDKARLLLLGPTIRRMANTNTPALFKLPYRTVIFPGANGTRLEAWSIPGETGRPTVLMFPGYGGSKDTLLRAAAEFHALGCETWLVDFSGVGGSEGNTTTIGWREAEDVAAAVRAARGSRAAPVVLYGTSMGATAILCAAHRGFVAPDAMILECPFDRLATTLGNRLQLLGIPRVPLAPCVAFWIGIQNGFNGHTHNPVDYARSVRCPVLLMQGENDQFVGRPAIESIAAAMGDYATLKIFPGCGHAFLVRDGESIWRPQVKTFLSLKLPSRKLSTQR